MEQSAAGGTSSTAAGGSIINSSNNSSIISNSGGNNNNNNNNSGSTSTVIVQGSSTTTSVSHHQEESITEIQQQQQQQQQQQHQHQSDQKSFIQLSQHQQHHHQQQHHHHHQHHQHHHQHQRILLQGTTTSSATPSPVLSPPGKLLGRNTNGTMVSTSTPSNEAELQLYRVLQRASLLAYYDTLLEMGGDDVQQLCDAGEEEFLEIMALVGMASKPLHVRRLQKSLHEWVNNPSSFQTPLPNVDTSRIVYSPDPPIASRSPFSTSQGYSPSSISGASSTNPNFGNISSISSVVSNMPPTATISPNIISTSSGAGTSSIQLTPSLSETQLTRLIAAAERLSRDLPQLEPRPQSSKKRSSKELEQVMAMDECDPRRMDEIRKYAAIYGRFDCKRRPEKPLTLHEVCVNEAAAQICKFVPALLTRRDELFPLARQVVRDSGFGHSAGIARYGSVGQSFNRNTEQSSDTTTNQSSKRMRLSSESTSTDFNKETPDELRHNLLAIYQKLGKQFDMCSESTKYTSNYPRSDEYDDTDSRYSFSNSSSPPLQSSNAGDMESNHPDHADDATNTATTTTTTTTTTGTGTIGTGTNTTTIRSPLNDTNNRINSSPLGVHVISSAGGHIIAVANPALALSPALVESLNIKRERMSPDI